MSCWNKVKPQVISDVNHMTGKIGRLKLPATKHYPRRPTDDQAAELERSLAQVLGAANFSKIEQETRTRPPGFGLSFTREGENFCLRLAMNSNGCNLTLSEG